MRPIGDWSMSMTLSRCWRPVMLVVRAGEDSRAVQGAGGGGVERVDGERGLAAAADAGDAGEGAEGEIDGDIGEVVGAGAVDGDSLAAALAALRRDRDFAAAGEVIGGERALAFEQLLERAREDHLAAVDSGAGAHVDDMVGVADGVLVMLDHQHGVAERFRAAGGFRAGGRCPSGGGRSRARRGRRGRRDRPEPICDARRMRWLSPPDSVPLVRSRLR